MDLSIEEKALIAISELKTTRLSLEVQRQRAKELYECLDSRIKAIDGKIKELEA